LDCGLRWFAECPFLLLIEKKSTKLTFEEGKEGRCKWVVLHLLISLLKTFNRGKLIRDEDIVWTIVQSPIFGFPRLISLRSWSHLKF
ncbi:hypothetical protein EB077_02545, partial [bacterium]|nr:hypothetical protein [bacterium]